MVEEVEGLKGEGRKSGAGSAWGGTGIQGVGDAGAVATRVF